MKSLLKTTLLSLLVAPALVACGNAPQMMSVPQMSPQMMRPMNAPQFARQNTATDMNAQYWLGQVESSQFRPDENGMQFSFDYVTLNFRDYTKQGLSTLTIAYSVHQNNSYVRIDYSINVGTPDETRVPISQNDSKELGELNFFLSTLMTHNADDKANLERILKKFGEILGTQPLPQLPVGNGNNPVQSQSVRRFR